MHLTLTSADWIICIGALVFNVLLGLYFALRARRQTEAGRACLLEFVTSAETAFSHRQGAAV